MYKNRDNKIPPNYKGVLLENTLIAVTTNIDIDDISKENLKENNYVFKRVILIG